MPEPRTTNEEPKAAVGIPDRGEYGDLSQLKAKQLLDWIVQRHAARRAGLHYDVRFGDKDKGLYSWAVRKGLPKPGQKHLAIQQPLHAHGYQGFEGEIPSGYGAGHVSKHDQGQVLLTKAGPDGIHFTTAHRRFPERYALVPYGGQDGKRQWLLLNTTKTEAIPYEKKRYAKVPADQAEAVLGNLAPGSTVQAKLDGAASLTKLFKDHAEVVSYRARKDTGGPIVHSERVAGGRIPADVPPRLVGSVLRGELYGVNQEGKAIPPQALGGLLNSSVANSLATQQAKGIKLRNMLFDVEQMGGKKVTEPSYQKRREQLQGFLKHLPAEYFHTPEEATTPEAAKTLWQGIKGGTNPLTREGVVVHPPTGTPQKIKLHDDYDVHIRDFFPGQGKYQGNAVGGFRYSHEPQGPVVGEVGSGFSDETRRTMHQDPGAFLGRVAKVRAQEKLPSGALRAPSFLSLHEDLPLATKAAAQASLSHMGLLGASCSEMSPNVGSCCFLPFSGHEPGEALPEASTPSSDDCLMHLDPDCASPMLKAASVALRELRLLRPDSQGFLQRYANTDHGLHKVARKRKSPDMGRDAQVPISSNTPERDISGKEDPGIPAISVKPQAYLPEETLPSAGTGQGPVEIQPVSFTPEQELGAGPTPPLLSGQISPPSGIGENRNILAQLLAAKAHSDKKRYKAKHALMRQLIMARPREFAVDSSARGIAGITHVPTGFRMHLPQIVLPAGLRKLEGVNA